MDRPAHGGKKPFLTLFLTLFGTPQKVTKFDPFWRVPWKRVENDPKPTPSGPPIPPPWFWPVLTVFMGFDQFWRFSPKLMKIDENWSQPMKSDHQRSSCHSELRERVINFLSMTSKVISTKWKLFAGLTKKNYRGSYRLRIFYESIRSTVSQSPPVLNSALSATTVRTTE